MNKRFFMKIIDRYILKSHLGPFLFAFITIVFVLILQFFATFADRFIGKGIEFSAIVELIVLQSAWMVGLAAPMAVLIAVVMVLVLRSMVVLLLHQYPPTYSSIRRV